MLVVGGGERRVQLQRVLGEAVLGEDALEMRMADEHRAGAEFAQGLGDADAVQRGAETGLGEEGDGSCSLRHGHIRVLLTGTA